MSISRRTFLETTSALAAAGLAGSGGAEAQAQQAPEATRPTRPVVIASKNGLRGVARAYELMTTAQADPLDAIIAGVNIQELDPEDQSVGLGGLPNEEGVVQLDASCMHGPTNRAGAVAALEGIATPSRVAKAVLEYTDHILLVGADAKKFALKMGFKEQDLLTEKSRREWLEWKTRLHPRDNWLEGDGEVKVSTRTGTINMNAVNAAGDLASLTSTSGLAWKIPGRVGDSPLIGAGQYCDNTVGAAGGTGRGEANIKCCGAFLIVELMRAGTPPREACLLALKRAVAMTESRLLDGHGRPLYGLSFYALAKDGRYGAATMYQPPPDHAKLTDSDKFAVADARGARLEPFAFLYPHEDAPEPVRRMHQEKLEQLRRT
ncbi:MAG: N(4)-(beta-N-acetylglucosaminyl)-L-asparaginase [Phycisphaerae bacterium]|jgi:N4-(beta-N-acetylglucosaminyl)-L-asparaginase